MRLLAPLPPFHRHGRYNNAELSSLIVALGLGLKGAAFDEGDLRYHKVRIQGIVSLGSGRGHEKNCEHKCSPP